MNKKGLVVGLASMAVACVFAGTAHTLNAQAQTVLDESKFQMLQATSVRMGTGTKEDPTGLRFHTIATEFKEDLQDVYSENTYHYNWYTEIRFKRWQGDTYLDGKNNEYKKYTTYENQVGTLVWKDDGWNTVLLNIPMMDASLGLPSDAAMQITAQSYVEVKDKTGVIVYQAETQSLTYSAAKTASHALARGLYKNDTQKQLLMSYVDHAIACGDLTTLNLPRETFGVQVGEAEWLETSTFPAGYGVTYTSADPSIAKVDEDGRITGVKAGTTTVTVSVGSTLKKTCAVTVYANKDALAPITSWKWSLLGNSTYPLETNMSVSNNKIAVNHTNVITPNFNIASDYAEKVFAFSSVKALRIYIDGFPAGYKVQHFITDYNRANGFANDYDSYTSFEHDGTNLYLQIHRGAYEYYLKSRVSAEEPFTFRFQYGQDGLDLNDVVKLPSKYYINRIEPIYDDLTLDFEDRAYNDANVYTSKYVLVDADTVGIQRVADRTMGRGSYSLAATTAGQSLSVNIASAYVNKVFASGANVLQFRVYTNVNLKSVTVNGTTANVQYVYNADGEYYSVRIGNAYNGSALSVVLTAETALGTVYFDAFTASDKALGENITLQQAFAIDDGGEPNYKEEISFKFYAYSSVGDGTVKQEGDYIDMDFDMEPIEGSSLYKPTLESFLELKKAGFYAVMPQSNAVIGANGAAGGTFDYRAILDLAEQAGLKVILTDNILLYLSSGQNNFSSAWVESYESTKTANGAAAAGTAMYNMVKAQLLSYINHPAFYGVLLRDEPQAWMLDPNAPVEQIIIANVTDEKEKATYTKYDTDGDGKVDKYRPGTYGFVYKTIKQVAADLGKEIYIHANLIGATTYSAYSNHTEANATYRYPELTRERYCEILGISLSQTYENIGGKDAPSSLSTTTPLKDLSDIDFYNAVEAYIRTIGTTGGHENIRRRTVQFQIMRERFAAYCQLFIDVTGAPFIAPDFYPLYSEGPMDNYIMALQTAAEVARANDVDLYIISQTQSYVPGNSTSTRILSDADVRWLNNTLLSFGVKNIIYFTYHQHGDDTEGFFHDGSSWKYTTGENTPLWYDMQRLLAENQAFANTYQAFTLHKTKVYYDPLSTYGNDHLSHAHDVVYDNNVFDNAPGKNVDVAFALQSVDVSGETTIISEYKDANGRYMYSVMNVIDSQWKDADTYQSVTLTFNEMYTHAVVWRNGVKKLVALDENNAIMLENGAGECVFVIPYKYKNQSGYWNDNNGENGVWFPGNEGYNDDVNMKE